MILNKFKFIINSLKSILLSCQLIPLLYELNLDNNQHNRRLSSDNPFFKDIKRYSLFSQSDEDSIIDEITNRLEIKAGRFIELGVGDGLQNNTLNLLANSWQGIWVGGEDIAFNHGAKLKFLKKWITKDNIFEILNNEIKDIESKYCIDLLSIDLDGNDYHIWQTLLSRGVHPKILVAEFNGLLGPKAEWIMPYQKDFFWKKYRSMYFGASFNSFLKLFKKFNYIPICCNTDTGVNLFMVEKEFENKFQELINLDPIKIYESPHYLLSKGNNLHKSSSRLASSISKLF